MRRGLWQRRIWLMFYTVELKKLRYIVLLYESFVWDVVLDNLRLLIVRGGGHSVWGSWGCIVGVIVIVIGWKVVVVLLLAVHI